MFIKNVLASVAVKDLQKSIAWYTQLFSRAADSIPMPEVAEWKFERGGWLQIYQDRERAGKGSFTLAVSDIAEAIAHAQKLNIDTSNTTSTPKVKTLMIVDLDGNHIAFAEAVDEKMAH